MSTLIVYATKYGCTEKCALKLAEKLDGNVELCNLKKQKHPDLAKYDKVIIGGAIYMGKIRKEVQRFCQEHIIQLLGKKIGLFICCMRDGDVAETELLTAYDSDLIQNATITDYFGGEFTMNKMNFFDRLIVRKVAKVTDDLSSIHLERIDHFAEMMNAS